MNQQNIGFDTTSPSTFLPSLLADRRLLFASDDQRMPFKKDLNNIQPRAGATFRIDDETVLRGGYALAYLPTFDNGHNNGFSVTTTPWRVDDGGITPTGLSNPYPGRARPAGRQLAGASTLVGRGFTFSDPERTLRAPVLGGVQRELPGRLALDMSFVGSRTRVCRCPRGSTRSPPNSSRPAPSCCSRSPTRIRASCRGRLQWRHGAAPAEAAAFRSSPDQRGSPAVRRQRRRAADQRQQAVVGGLQFLVSYTYSRTEEEVTYLNPQDDWDQLDARRHRRRLAASPALQQHLSCRSSRTSGA